MQNIIARLNSKLLLSASIITASIALVIGATFAFFSDTETSQNNLLEAGAVDLKIDNTSYLNGVLNPGTTWTLSDLTDQLFFNFHDIKPGDVGEDTISLRVQNDAWACANFNMTKNDDNTCTEPELLDDPDCDEPDGDVNDGDLAQNLNFVFWTDDGDNVLETGETIIKEGTAGAALNTDLTLADSNQNNLGGQDGDPLEGSTTYYIGKAWCFGTLTLAPLSQDGQGAGGPRTPANSSGGISCDGTSLNNATQTDIVMADFTFNAVQARNNPNFLCFPLPTPTPTPIPSPSPSPQACNQADVMLVLDRSGSINSTELGQLKTAAKDFVDSLGLSALGIHAGKSSFATTGNLNHHLTDDPVSLKAAIDAMTSGGLTNLKAGIDLAKTEMDNPGDGHDRADGTSPDKMIIITDGHPNRPLPSSTSDDVAAASADAARLAGSEIFVVGVGSDVNQSYLENEIADDSSHYFSVSDYSALQDTLEDLDLCD